MSLDRQIMRIAIPSIVSNITVPLLGLVDLAIVGHLGATAYIGAIAVGGMIFNVMYWIFGFMRMGTSGLTAQAYGRHDLPGIARLLTRSLLISFLIAIMLMLLQWPIFHLIMWLMSPTAEVAKYVQVYFDICVWGIPPSLLLFAFSGWFLGMQDSKTPMTIAIVQNVSNIVLSLLFVYGFAMKVDGVALGTLLAQYVGLVIAAAVYLLRYRKVRRYVKWGGVLNRKDMMQFFVVNRDIFLRTICLVAVFLFFTSAGSWQGDTILAVNTILMQFFMFFSYIMDGFAYAGEALAGKFYGAGNSRSLRFVVRRLFLWGAAMTALFTLTYFVADRQIVALLTNDPNVMASVSHYSFWTWLFPLAGVAAFIWDGVFVGLTASRGMLVSSAIATALFFCFYYSLFPLLANHALWLAFIIYLLGRGVSQTLIYRKLQLG